MRSCGRVARAYARALDRAKRVIEAEREEYEEAKAAQASGGLLVGDLSVRRGHVEPDRQGGFDDAIADAQDAIAAAGDRAQTALFRARRAREDFDEAQQEAVGALDGTAPGATPAFGGPAAPALGGPAMGPAFPAGGTGGMGSGGGGFGVPAGGLGAFSGLVPFDRLGAVDGYAKNAWLDKHGQTEVDDLTIAITSAASFGTAGPLSALATRGAGGVAAREGATTAARGGARTGAGRAGGTTVDDAARAGGNADLRAANLETLGDGLGKAGLPFGGEAGKVAGLLSREEFRAALAVTTRAQLAAAEKETKSRFAALLAARELSRGVKRGVPDEAIERMMRQADVP